MEQGQGARVREAFARPAATKGAAGGGRSGGGRDAAAWAAKVPLPDRPAWLVECYLRRVRDDAQWGGGMLHGLRRNETAPPPAVQIRDFLHFCLLAAEAKALPEGWCWAPCLSAASRKLRKGLRSGPKSNDLGDAVSSATFEGATPRRHRDAAATPQKRRRDAAATQAPTARRSFRPPPR